MLVGLILRAVGARTGLMMRSMGYVFMTIGGLCALGVTIPLLRPLNGWITTAITIVVEVLLIRLAKISYRRLAYAFGGLARRQLTGRKGWAFTSRATVPVPSPATAVRLLAVPNQAISTEGRSVVRKKIDEVEVLVFDRVRAKPIADDRPQTVFYVKLPVRQPFLTPTQLGNADSDTWWVDGDYLISVAVGRGPGGIPNGGIDAMARNWSHSPAPPTGRFPGPRPPRYPLPPASTRSWPRRPSRSRPAAHPEQLRRAPDITFEPAAPNRPTRAPTSAAHRRPERLVAHGKRGGPEGPPRLGTRSWETSNVQELAVRSGPARCRARLRRSRRRCGPLKPVMPAMMLVGNTGSRCCRSARRCCRTAARTRSCPRCWPARPAGRRSSRWP